MKTTINHIPGQYKAVVVDLDRGLLQVNDESVLLPIQSSICPDAAALRSLWACKYRQAKTQARAGAQSDWLRLSAMAGHVVRFQDFVKLVEGVILADNRSEALKSASGKNPDDCRASHTRVYMDLALQLLALGCGASLTAFGTRRSLIRELLLIGEGKRTLA